MKTLNLTISERIRALALLNAFKGSLEQLAVIVEDIKQFSISDAEWEQAERVITDNGDGTQRMTWKDENVPEKEITLQPVTLEYLRKTIAELDEKGEFSLTDQPFITLFSKLA